MKRNIITASRASAIIYGLAGANQKGIWLLPANVCPAVPLALMQAGTAFEFIDINPASLCMDVEQACQRIAEPDSPPVAGLIYVRSYGFAAHGATDLQTLRQALPGSTILVDDQCLSTPDIDLDTRPNNDASAVIFSTGYGKVLDLGGGGYGVLYGQPAYAPPPAMSAQDAALAYTAMTARYKDAMQSGDVFSNENIAPWICGNPGADWPDLKARISKTLPDVIVHKKMLNQVYDDGLRGLDGINPLAPNQHIWRYTVLAHRRDEFLALLFRNGLFASAHYYPASLLFGGHPCPRAHALHKSVLNFFNDVHFSIEQAEHVVSLARDFYSPQ